MGRKNAVTKRFCSDRVRVADLVNVVYFRGKSVIHSEDLTESSEGYAQPVEKTGHEEDREYLERLRDIKMLHKYGSTIRILAVENQSYIDYGMPIRCMEYDALEYRLEFLAVVMDNPAIWKNRHKFKKSVNETEDTDKKEQEEYDMCQAIRELIEDGKQEGIREGIREGRMQILVDMVKEGLLKMEDAALRCGLSVEEFCKQMAVAAN